MRQAKIAPPAGISPDAAIYMIGSEFLFVGRKTDGRAVEQKYVSPGAIRQALSAEPVDSGWLPADVRRYGVGARGHWMLAWHPPAMYSVWLGKRKRPLRVPMPALAFFGQGSKYYLWAMRESKFDPKARLYNAPCANVSTIGLICWGTNPHPDVQTGCFEAMWRTFWDAPFSGSWADGKSRLYPHNANDALLALGKDGAKTYPVSDLTELDHSFLRGSTTLDTIVERITRRGE